MSTTGATTLIEQRRSCPQATGGKTGLLHSWMSGPGRPTRRLWVLTDSPINLSRRLFQNWAMMRFRCVMPIDGQCCGIIGSQGCDPQLDLQDSTLDNILSLTEIASDFSPSDNSAKLSEMLSLLGSCFCMVGSAASMVGVAVTRLSHIGSCPYSR
ncbi:hypothetical protein K458DRAFT_403704 [Lentithecium fluviatile CBS 122367]|uniref:Uncharacterized protein n=1 Tax=Lentithecium fluviatile CBS 122367 TaxID=1168545 RepID=A0A6G1J2I2_9PLEO|nr:hypothetical protein K458DRAFT_403704 [Lentithecium fluviatile CBS 122367]